MASSTTLALMRARVAQALNDTGYATFGSALIDECLTQALQEFSRVTPALSRVLFGAASAPSTTEQKQYGNALFLSAGSYENNYTSAQVMRIVSVRIDGADVRKFDFVSLRTFEHVRFPDGVALAGAYVSLVAAFTQTLYTGSGRATTIEEQDEQILIAGACAGACYAKALSAGAVVNAPDNTAFNQYRQMGDVWRGLFVRGLEIGRSRGGSI